MKYKNKVLLICIVTIAILLIVIYPSFPPSQYIADDPMNQFAHWDKSIVTVNLTGEDLTPRDYEVVSASIDNWNSKVGKPIIQLTNGSADIPIEYITANTANKRHIDSSKYMAMTLYTVEDTTIQTTTITTLSHSQSCITHEMCHAMGLIYHSKHINSILYPSIDSWFFPLMSPEDIATAKEIYKCY